MSLANRFTYQVWDSKFYVEQRLPKWYWARQRMTLYVVVDLKGRPFLPFGGLSEAKAICKHYDEDKAYWQNVADAEISADQRLAA